MKTETNIIKALDKQSDNEKSSYLPKSSFIMTISASRGSGKSTLIINILTNKNLLAGKFQQIYLISPTSCLDTKFELLKKTNIKAASVIPYLSSSKKISRIMSNPNFIKIDDRNKTLKMTDRDFISLPSISFLENLIESQKTQISAYGKDKADNVLLIYDDCILDPIFKSKSFIGLVFNSRHFKISIIISSQCYFSIPKPIRLNSSVVLVFFTANKKELTNIYEENNAGLSNRAFLTLFNKITQPDWQFIVFNYANKKKDRIQNCFNDFIKYDNLK